VTNRLTETEKRAAVKLYEQGETMTAIGQLFGVTRSAIGNLLRFRGVTMRQSGKLSRAQRADVVRRYEAGASQQDLAASFGVSVPSVRSLLTRRAVPLRRPVRTLNEEVFDEITSNRLADRLLDLGRYADVIDDELVSSRHFWRGVVDGDGSVGAYPFGPTQQHRPQLRVVGRLALLRQFTSFLAKNRMSQLQVHPHKTIYSVGTTGGSAAEIACLLYADASVALKRKAEAAEALINDVLLAAFRKRELRLSGESVTQLPVFDASEAA
jgi:transposase